MWLCGIPNATSCWGQYFDGKEKWYPGHSSNLKPLERNLSSSQMCTLQTMRNLRFSIALNALACSSTVIGLGECNIIPQILQDP